MLSWHRVKISYMRAGWKQPINYENTGGIGVTDTLEALSNLEENELDITGINMTDDAMGLDGSENEYDIDYEFDDTEAALTDPLSAYYRQAAAFPLLSQSEEQELFKAYKETGDKEYRDKIINHNLRLPLHVLKKYRGISSVDVDDLIQVGNVALLKSVECFNHEYGDRFSTYAIVAIEQSMRGYINECSHAVKVPRKFPYTQYQYSKLIDDYKEKHGMDSEPPKDYVLKELDISEDIYKELVYYRDIRYVSLDRPINNGNDEADDTLLSDRVPSDGKIDTELNNVELRTTLLAILDSLRISEKDKSMMRYRLGLDDGIARTFKEVGSKYNVSRQRVEQVQKRMLKMMRAPAISERLKDYIYD